MEQTKNRSKLKLDKGQYNKLNEYLDINWDDYLDSADSTVDEMWDKFKLLVLHGITTFTPICGRGQQKSSKKIFQPFTAKLRCLIKCKHWLCNRWISSRDEAVHTEHKVIRNKVKSEVVKLIQQEQQKVAHECERNPKRFWQFINRKTKYKSDVGVLKWRDPDGNEMLTENQIKSN